MQFRFNPSSRFAIALSSAVILVATQAAIAVPVTVNNYSWLQLAPGDVTTVWGGAGANGSAHGQIEDVRWGNFIWVPSSGMTNSANGQYWAGVRLDESRNVSSVAVEWWATGNQTLTRFYVDGSNDGTSWTQIAVHNYNVVQTSIVRRELINLVTPSSWQYVRARFEPGDYASNNVGGYGGPGVYSVEPFGNGSIDDNKKVNYANPTNFAVTTSANLLASAHSDRRFGVGAQNGSFQDSGVHFGANGDMVAGEYLQVNFGAQRRIDEVITLTTSGPYHAPSYTIEYFNGFNYVPITAGLSGPTYYPDGSGYIAATGYTFPYVSTTSIRLTNMQDGPGGYFLIGEILALYTVPEPTGVGMMVAGACVALTRRRSRS